MAKYSRTFSLVHLACRFLPGLPPKAYFLNSLADDGALLDLGCGVGSKFDQYRRIRPDLRLYGCDIVDVLDRMPGNINFCIVNIEVDSLPWPADYFDGIILNHVLEHLGDADHALKEMHRVLKTGGKVYIATPSEKSLKYPSFIKWLNREGGPINFFDDPTHIKAYPRQELAILLQRLGFSRIKTGTVRNLPGMLLAPLLVLFGFLTRNRKWAGAGIHQLTGWSIYAIADKT